MKELKQDQSMDKRSSVWSMPTKACPSKKL